MNMWVNISGEMFNISKIHAGDAVKTQQLSRNNSQSLCEQSENAQLTSDVMTKHQQGFRSGAKKHNRKTFPSIFHIFFIFLNHCLVTKHRIFICQIHVSLQSIQDQMNRLCGRAAAAKKQT